MRRSVDRISIVDARGLHGDGAGDGAEGASGNLADAAVAAAMRYRVGGPLIDGLPADLGMAGGSLNGLLAAGEVSNLAVSGTSSGPSRVNSSGSDASTGGSSVR